MSLRYTAHKARWFSDEAKYSELRVLLAHPVLEEALQLTADAGLPKLVASEHTPTERLSALAIEQARVAGWHEALNYLYRLTSPSVPTPPHDRKSWSHKTK